MTAKMLPKIIDVIKHTNKPCGSQRFARCWLGSVHGNHSGRMFDNIVHFNFGDAGQMTYNWNKYRQNKKLTST